MISIHLRRTGAKKDPHYRVVVADSRDARDGAFIEILGHYHPRFEPAKVVLDVEKTKAWIDKGAQPSDTVKSLLRKVETGALAVEQAVPPSRHRAATEGDGAAPPKAEAPQSVKAAEPEAAEPETEPEADVQAEATPEPSAEGDAAEEKAEAAAGEPSKADAGASDDTAAEDDEEKDKE